MNFWSVQTWYIYLFETLNMLVRGIRYLKHPQRTQNEQLYPKFVNMMYYMVKLDVYLMRWVFNGAMTVSGFMGFWKKVKASQQSKEVCQPQSKALTSTLCKSKSCHMLIFEGHIEKVYLMHKHMQINACEKMRDSMSLWEDRSVSLGKAHSPRKNWHTKLLVRKVFLLTSPTFLLSFQFMISNMSITRYNIQDEV